MLRRVLLPVLLLCTLLALPAHATAPPRPAGHWEGSIELPGTKLAFDIDVVDKDGAFTGDISIPAQNARDLPLSGIVLEGRTLKFAIAGVPGDPTFKGDFDDAGDEVKGGLMQGGALMPFAMKRAAAPADKARGALDGFDPFVEKLLADFEVPGLSLAVVRDGQVVLARGYGLADVKAKRAVTGDTLFAIGSSSKAFTTLLLGTLVDEAKLDWDKPVRTWLPDLQLYDHNAADRLTPRDMVTHRSGLPRHDLVWYNDFDLTRAEILKRLAYLPPNKDLRETWQYNNLMFVTAGHLAERITGSTWEDLVRGRILGPLGMTSTVLTTAAARGAADVARPYDKRKDAVIEIPYYDQGKAMGPAGSIYSSATDMARWAMFQLGDGTVPGGGKRLVEAATLADMHVPQMAIAAPPNPLHPEVGPESYGMGWFIDSYRGHQRVHHGGNINGFSCLVALYPEDHVGIVAIVNMDGSAVPDLVARHAFDRVAGLPAHDWAGEALVRRKAGMAEQKEAEKKAQVARVAGTSPAHPLAEYAGTYAHPGYGTMSFAFDGKKLAGRFHELPLPLGHWHYETFDVQEDADNPVLEHTKVTFLTAEDGTIEALKVTLDPLSEPVVFARQPDARMTDPAFLATLAGDYTLALQTIHVGLRGNALVTSVPGQPVFELVPGRGLSFTLKGLTGFTVRFVLDAKGKVTEAQFIQPNGVFTAKPK